MASEKAVMEERVKRAQEVAKERINEQLQAEKFAAEQAQTESKAQLDLEKKALEEEGNRVAQVAIAGKPTFVMLISTTLFRNKA